MKLQVSFDLPDIQQALEVAKQVDEYASSFQIGSLLLYKYGIEAAHQFRTAFPDKTITLDTKIVDRPKDIIALCAEAKLDWITVLAGTSNQTIHNTSTQSHKEDIMVMLDLLDARSIGQSALEAKGLAADAVLLHTPYDEGDTLIFLDKWDMVRGNTDLPIWISGKIPVESLVNLQSIKPDGIIIGREITEAEDPKAEALRYHEAIRQHIEAHQNGQ